MNDESPLSPGSGPALPPPSRESLREVKAEAKERQKARRAGFSSVEAYRARPRRSRRGIVVVGSVVAAAVVVGAAWFLLPELGSSSPSAAGDGPSQDEPDIDTEQEARRLMARGPWKNWKPGMAGLRFQPPQEYVGPGVTVSRGSVALALAATLPYLKAALFDPAVLFDGEVRPVLRTLGGDPAQLEKAWESGTEFVARESGYMTRFRPGWTGASGVPPRSSGRVEYGVRTEIVDGEASAAFIVSFKVRVAYPVVVGEDQDAVDVVVVTRNGELMFGQERNATPYWRTGGWTSSAGTCGPTQSITSEWVSAVPNRLLPPGKDHCFA